MNLTGRFTLPGHVANSEVATWFAACDVFCLPSHSEGCPNVIIEARACGRPVVATTAGGISEVTSPDNAILVEPRSPEDLAGALLAALERDWDPLKIAAGLCSWDEVAARAFAVCRRALGGG